ncbi:MAG: hypothetical protein LBP65_04085 [Puniceicoccales bacterium]|nr:hypothetical protein [Puniceicoccales bacterium]
MDSQILKTFPREVAPSVLVLAAMLEKMDGIDPNERWARQMVGGNITTLSIFLKTITYDQRTLFLSLRIICTPPTIHLIWNQWFSLIATFHLTMSDERRFIILPNWQRPVHSRAFPSIDDSDSFSLSTFDSSSTSDVDSSSTSDFDFSFDSDDNDSPDRLNHGSFNSANNDCSSDDNSRSSSCPNSISTEDSDNYDSGDASSDCSIENIQLFANSACPARFCDFFEQFPTNASLSFTNLSYVNASIVLDAPTFGKIQYAPSTNPLNSYVPISANGRSFGELSEDFCNHLGECNDEEESSSILDTWASDSPLPWDYEDDEDPSDIPADNYN